ncbi:hypothetical protein Fcan01_23863 [Folsomia candida]|uniref:Uncharacterized protein n=1 Tax=Folsomia candida TaxID=158441 RepID=A0A226D9P2_FOLCA|nr:hypothetical protein Fcan01_23863 [Folsomia candida]
MRRKRLSPEPLKTQRFHPPAISIRRINPFSKSATPPNLQILLNSLIKNPFLIPTTLHRTPADFPLIVTLDSFAKVLKSPGGGPALIGTHCTACSAATPPGSVGANFLKRHYAIQDVCELSSADALEENWIGQFYHKITFSNNTSPVEVITRLSQRPKEDLSSTTTLLNLSNLSTLDLASLSKNQPVFWSRDEFTSSNGIFNPTSNEICQQFLTSYLTGDDPELDYFFELSTTLMVKYLELSRGTFGFSRVDGVSSFVVQTKKQAASFTFEIKGADGVTRNNFEDTVTNFDTLWVQGCKCAREFPYREDYTSSGLARKCFKLDDTLRFQMHLMILP